MTEHQWGFFGKYVNSEKFYHDALAAICSKYKKDYTKEIQEKLIGKTDEVICQTIVRELKIPVSAKELDVQLREMLAKVLPKSNVKEGVIRLLSHLHEHNIPTALATNSLAPDVQVHEKNKPEVFKFFHHKVTISDPELKRGKPEPDIYLLVASRFPGGPEPFKCLAFEDSIAGMTAACAAGMQVVMIPMTKLPEEDTREATIVISSLLHFKPELFGLPPFETGPEDVGGKGDNCRSH